MDDRIKAAFEVGREQWPAVRDFTLEAFGSFLSDAAVDPDVLGERAGDLYVAAAAVGGNDEAVKVIDALLTSDLPRWLSNLRLRPDAVDEVRQQLRLKLLLGPRPRLSQYRGAGALGAWLRVAGMRTALDICAADSPIADKLQDPDSLLLDSIDPEQALVRKKYGALFETALRGAFAELSKRDRTLLRFHYVAGMSHDAIGRTYHVHRATVVRWLAAIRDELDGAVRIRLWNEVGVSPSEFRSLWRAVNSEIAVSLSRLLAGAAPRSSSSP